MSAKQKGTYLKLLFCVASVLLISAVSGSSADDNDPQDCKKYGMVANDVGWCVPVMKLTGDLQKIFNIIDCNAISGLTCRISYNGKLPLPSEVFFIELDKDGSVVGKKTRLIYPKLEPGETGYATFRINSVSTATIVLSGICRRKWGQIFILDIAGWRRASMRFLLRQTESKVKDKDLTPIFWPQLISNVRRLG